MLLLPLRPPLILDSGLRLLDVEETFRMLDMKSKRSAVSDAFPPLKLSHGVLDFRHSVT